MRALIIFSAALLTASALAAGQPEPFLRTVFCDASLAATVPDAVLLASSRYATAHAVVCQEVSHP